MKLRGAGKAMHAPGSHGATLCGRVGGVYFADVHDDVDCRLCLRNPYMVAESFGWKLLGRNSFPRAENSFLHARTGAWVYMDAHGVWWVVRESTWNTVPTTRDSFGSRAAAMAAGSLRRPAQGGTK